MLKRTSPNAGSGTSPRACPICGKAPADALAPFCSKRCADVDLHRWLGGVYAIPDDGPDDGSDVPPDDSVSGDDK